MEYEKAKNEDNYLREANKFISSVTKRDENQRNITEIKPVETSPRPTSSSGEIESLSGPNCVNVKVNVFIDDKESQILVTIHKKRTVKELIKL
jgi:hypothetical protein